MADTRQLATEQTGESSLLGESRHVHRRGGRSQHLLVAPPQVRFELRQHGGEAKTRVSGSWPSAGAGDVFNNNANRIEQSLKIAFLHQRCPKIRHDESPQTSHPESVDG